MTCGHLAPMRRTGNDAHGPTDSQIRGGEPQTDIPSQASSFWALVLENNVLSNQVCPDVVQVLSDLEMLTTSPLLVPNPVTNQGMQGHAMSSAIPIWTAPLGPDRPPYTCRIQWCEPGFSSEVLNTSGTWVMVGAGKRARYTFTVR